MKQICSTALKEWVREDLIKYFTSIHSHEGEKVDHATDGWTIANWTLEPGQYSLVILIIEVYRDLMLLETHLERKVIVWGNQPSIFNITMPSDIMPYYLVIMLMKQIRLCHSGICLGLCSLNVVTIKVKHKVFIILKFFQLSSVRSNTLMQFTTAFWQILSANRLW